MDATGTVISPSDQSRCRHRTRGHFGSRLTRELLERDGEPPLDVYREFAEYSGRSHSFLSIWPSISIRFCCLNGGDWGARLSAAGASVRCVWPSVCWIRYPPGIVSCRRCGSTTVCRNAEHIRLWAMCRLSSTCWEPSCGRLPKNGGWVHG